MNSSPLTSDLIAQPSLWSMLLMPTESQLDVALYPPLAHEEIIWRSFPLNPNAPTPLRALEDVVYANELLFADFRSITCILDNCPQLPMPSFLSQEQATTVYNASTNVDPEAAAPIQMFNTSVESCRIALRQNDAIKNFFSRTFFNIKFDSAIASLCRNLISNPAYKATGSYSAVVNCIIQRSTLKLIVSATDRILMANTYAYTSDADAAYYILFAVSTLGLDIEQTLIRISSIAGGPQSASSLQSIQRYIPSAAPLPFPMLRHRLSQSALAAPLPLLFNPDPSAEICE